MNKSDIELFDHQVYILQEYIQILYILVNGVQNDYLKELQAVWQT